MKVHVIKFCHKTINRRFVGSEKEKKKETGLFRNQSVFLLFFFKTNEFCWTKTIMYSQTTVGLDYKWDTNEENKFNALNTSAGVQKS